MSDFSIIDLRSDTQTQPTPRMRQAIAKARLGDETFGEDPTVRELEATVTELLGFEAALLTISATMANLIALIAYCHRGGEVFLDRNVHLLRAEAGGIGAIAGLVPTIVESRRGHLLPEALAAAIHAPSLLSPTPQLVWLENTHNRAGGTVMTCEAQAAVADVAHRNGLGVHLDGARIVNAAVAQGLSMRDACAGADSVTLDFTKALSCPLGSMLVGPTTLIERARVARRMVGGGMRQAGVIAAAALVGLEDMADRVADDHATAQEIARQLSTLDAIGVDPNAVETNMIIVDVTRLGGSAPATALLRSAGVLVSERPPDHLRLVTHRHISPAVAREAAGRIARVARDSQSEADRPRRQPAAASQ